MASQHFQQTIVARRMPCQDARLAARQSVPHKNPIGTGPALLLGAAVAAGLVGLYLTLRKPAPADFTPPPEQIPNFSPGPQGTLYEVVGPYGVPLRIINL